MNTAEPNQSRRLVLVLLVAVMVALSWLGPLESVANRQVDAGLKRALVSFATARALNAVISLAQGTEVSFQPVGVGVNLTVGQVLDPVNDLVEQFSSLMLMASVAFGVQKVLMLVGAHWLISLLLTVTAGVWAVLYYRGQPGRRENLFSMQDARNLIRYGGMRPDRDWLQFDCALSYGLVEYLRTLDMLKEYGWSPSRCIPHGGHQMSLAIAAGLGLGGNESYPDLFQPYGGFPDGVEVVDSRCMQALLHDPHEDAQGRVQCPAA